MGAVLYPNIAIFWSRHYYFLVICLSAHDIGAAFWLAAGGIRQIGLAAIRSRCVLYGAMWKWCSNCVRDSDVKPAAGRNEVERCEDLELMARPAAPNRADACITKPNKGAVPHAAAAGHALKKMKLWVLFG